MDPRPRLLNFSYRNFLSVGRGPGRIGPADGITGLLEEGQKLEGLDRDNRPR